jgi:hypothetical protein
MDVSVDEREPKLPAWVQEKLRVLRERLRQEAAGAELAEEENARLRTLIEGKFAGETDADTFLVNEETGKEVPIGKGCDIRFADFYSARYGRLDQGGISTGGARVLIIETDKPMQIRPTLDPCVIIVARAG